MGHRISDIWPGLVIVRSVETTGLSVKDHPVVKGKFERSDSHLGILCVYRFPITQELCPQGIQLRCLRAPQHRSGNLDHAFCIFIFAGIQFFAGNVVSHAYAIIVHQRYLQVEAFLLAVFISDVNTEMDLCMAFAHIAVPHKNAAAGSRFLQKRMCDIQPVAHFELYVTVQSAIITEIQICLRFSRRHIAVIPIIQADHDKVLFAVLQLLTHIIHQRCVAAEMLLHFLTVQEQLADPHGALKFQKELLAAVFLRNPKFFTVNALSLIISASAGHLRCQFHTVRQAHLLRLFFIPFPAQTEQPIRVQIDFFHRSTPPFL